MQQTYRKMTELVVKTKLREFVRSQGFNLGSDVYEALNKEVLDLVSNACRRTALNKRLTLSGKDL